MSKNKKIIGNKYQTQIPDLSIKDAADTYYRAAIKLQCDEIYPSMNAAVIAIELYLKCLTSNRKKTPVAGGMYLIKSDPHINGIKGHALVDRFDIIKPDIKEEMIIEFKEYANSELRIILEKIDGVFNSTRYFYEKENKIKNDTNTYLQSLVIFMHDYIRKMPVKSEFYI